MGWSGGDYPGSMTKAVYDTNDDGKVDRAEHADTADLATVANGVDWPNVTNAPDFPNIYAPIAGSVTGGSDHDHTNGEGAQIDHGTLSGLGDDDHQQYIRHNLATSANDFLVSEALGSFVKKTIAEVKTILGLGTAAYEATTVFAPAANGVTNGDSHDHSGGDGGTIAYSSISGKPMNPIIAAIVFGRRF